VQFANILNINTQSLTLEYHFRLLLVVDLEESTEISFANLGICSELQRSLSELGYEEPTPIQAVAIPAIIKGSDVLGQAATGTGKTAAFALPILQKLYTRETRSNKPIALVLAPTRELAVQVSEATHRYGRFINARVVPIYGGQSISRQLKSLSLGVDIVIGTPGRILDHLKRGSLSLSNLEMVVLDEADEMLDMGFADEIDAILGRLPDQRQIILFSATLPNKIEGLINSYIKDPLHFRIKDDGALKNTSPLVTEKAYIVQRSYKSLALGRILDVELPQAALVFCRTRDEVDQLTEKLNGRGYRAEALHGGMSQEQRDRVVARLRSNTAELIVATDVAARGLDIDQLTHVFNYDVPSSPEAYVHRIGRVGRAGREGTAVTFAEPKEHRLLRAIERVTKKSIKLDKLPTLTDLRTKRLEAVEGQVREILEEGDLEQFRVIIDRLSEEFDIVEIALAAMKSFYNTSHSGDDNEQELPDLTQKVMNTNDGGGRNNSDRGNWPSRGNHNTGRPRSDSGRGNSQMVPLYLNIGHSESVRPKDIVGAIANEVGLDAREIGQIDIKNSYSLVEVSRDSAQDVISALKGMTIKGYKVRAKIDERPVAFTPYQQNRPSRDRDRSREKRRR